MDKDELEMLKDADEREDLDPEPEPGFGDRLEFEMGLRAWLLGKRNPDRDEKAIDAMYEQARLSDEMFARTKKPH